jgi:uncharacterized protein with PhoU and TrkA domain
MVGQPIGQIALSRRPGVRILGLKRGGEILRGDIEEHVLGAGDQLVVSSSPAELASLAEAYDFRTGLTGVGGGVVTAGPERPRDLSLVEAVVSSAHPIIGRRLADIPLLSKLRVRVLGLSRPRHVAGPELAEVRVRAGDRLLIAAGEDATQALQANVLLGTVTQTPARAFRRDRAPIAIATLAAVVLVAAVFALPIQALALLGAGIVLATRRGVERDRREHFGADLRYAGLRHGARKCRDRGAAGALGPASVHRLLARADPAGGLCADQRAHRKRHQQRRRRDPDADRDRAGAGDRCRSA